MTHTQGTDGRRDRSVAEWRGNLTRWKVSPPVGDRWVVEFFNEMQYDNSVASVDTYDRSNKLRQLDKRAVVGTSSTRVEQRARFVHLCC